MRPTLDNVPDVQRALVRSYPANLRDAGVGGVTQVLLVIDAVGVVVDREVRLSSGQIELDRAAVSVVDVMHFRPAVANGCRAFAVANIPVRYEVVGEDLPPRDSRN